MEVSWGSGSNQKGKETVVPVTLVCLAFEGCRVTHHSLHVQSPGHLGINAIIDSTSCERIPQFTFLPPRRVVLDYSREMGGHDLFHYTVL